MNECIGMGFQGWGCERADPSRVAGGIRKARSGGVWDLCVCVVAGLHGSVRQRGEGEGG